MDYKDYKDSSLTDLYRKLDPDRIASGKVVSTKLPTWGWILIGIGALLVVAAIVVVPVVLTLRKKTTVTITKPDPVTPTQVSVTFPVIYTSAILFRTTIPPTDGLTKSEYQVSQVKTPNVGFVACGRSTKSGYYVTNLLTGAVSGPAEISGITPGTVITQQINSFGPAIVASFIASIGMRECALDIDTATVQCQQADFANASLIDMSMFAVTTWKNQTLPINIASFDTDKHYTLQNGDNVVCISKKGIVGQSSNLICSFYTVNQLFIIFGVLNNASNTLDYSIYPQSTSQCDNSFSIQLPNVTETIVWADMTYDGKYLLVATGERILMYSHADPQSAFEVVDTLVPTDTTITNCSIDRLFVTGTDLWCGVSTTANHSVIVPFNTVTQTFDAPSGREIPTPSSWTNGAGPGVITPTDDKLFVVQSDTNGNADSLVINVTTM